MGYCYEVNGGTRRLVCDVCSTAGARKVPCPYVYCPAVAMCPTCRKDPAVKAHRAAYCDENCKAASAAFDAREAAEAAAKAAGDRVFCTASSAPDGKVEMGFRGADGEVVYLTVAKAVYDAAHAEKWGGNGVVTLSGIAGVS